MALWHQDECDAIESRDGKEWLHDSFVLRVYYESTHLSFTLPWVHWVL